MIRYQIRDVRTGEVKGTYKSRSTANKKCDQLDNKWGGYRYSVTPVGNVGQSLLPN